MTEVTVTTTAHIYRAATVHQTVLRTSDTGFYFIPLETLEGRQVGWGEGGGDLGFVGLEI